MTRLEHRFDTTGKPDDIAVEALEYRLRTFMTHADDIHRSDGRGLGRDVVQIAHHLLFVGDGDVEAFQMSISGKNLGQIFDLGNLEVDVFCVDAFIVELLVEVAYREGMSKGIAYQSVLIHHVFYFLLAKYIVQTPRVSRQNCTSSKPALRRISIISSPCGKASMVLMR